MDPKPFLEYLDKEMTIMGILSAFSVLAPAGMLATAIGKDSTVAADFWSSTHVFVIAGSIFCVLAASFFYRQRSVLAWFYGQISLIQARSSLGKLDEALLNDLLTEADSWATWWPYCCAFTVLNAGFAEYVLAIFFFISPSHPIGTKLPLHALRVCIFWTLPLVTAAICTLQTYVRRTYRYEDDAWTCFYRALRGK